MGGGGASLPNGDGTFFDDDVGCLNGCAFSSEPIFEGDVTAADIAAFEAVESPPTSGVCVLEPQLSNGTTPGAMFPRNWLRPRFRWAGSGSETLWEVRLRHESQPSELRAYTRDTQWLLPKQVWERMRDFETPVHVSIRGLGPGGVASGAEGDFEIAPVDAGGSLVFWATTSSLVTETSSKLQGFAVGDEAVVETLRASNVLTGNIPGEDGASPRGYYACGQPARPTCAEDPQNPRCCNPTGFDFGEVECVGCHVSTPDGKAVLFTDNWPWNKVAASIEPETVGALPATVTPYAANLMKQPWLGMQALSPAHFSTEPNGERLVVTSYGERPNMTTAPFNNQQPTRHVLAWFDLAANDPALPPIPEVIPPEPPLPGQMQNIYQVRDQRQAAVGAAYGLYWGTWDVGEPANRSAVTPTWSNDGTQIAYVSTDLASTDGHPDWRANVADIHVIDYQSRNAVSTMRPLPGASESGFLEYYPEYSADDKFIAFTRAPTPSVAVRNVPTQDDTGLVTTPAPQDLGEYPDGPYYNRNGEIYVIAREGGEPLRLVANDPPVCSGETSRNIINSWPKWSPRVETPEPGNKSYYFLIFSSARQYPGAFELEKARLTPAISNKSSQLYMAAIVVDNETNQVTTYPAVYLWNQNIVVSPNGEASIRNTSNLTPAWDDFSIAEVPEPLVIPR